MLKGKPAPGSTQAGLHFIDNEQAIVLIAKGSKRPEITGPRHDDAALAQDRLDHNRDDIGFLVRERMQGRKIVIGYMSEARNQRLETLLRPGIAGRA